MKNISISNKRSLIQSKLFIENNKNDFYIVEAKRVIDEILNLMTHSSFKILEQIDVDNLRQFWLEVVNEYQNKSITKSDILDIIDSLESYMNKRFQDDYPEFKGFIFPDSDPRSIGFNATDFIKDGIGYGNLLPNVIQPLLNYLQTPMGEEVEATSRMEQFMEDFKMKRLEKAERHPDGSYTITWSQLENHRHNIQ